MNDAHVTDGDRAHGWSEPLLPIESAVVDEYVTDALLSEDDLDMRRRIREVLAREVAPRADLVNSSHEVAWESYQALARHGLAAIIFPRDHGGDQRSTLTYAMAVEEVSAVCGATSLIYMTQTHAALPIMSVGTKEQRTRYLPGLANGSLYGSLAISEPDAGSDMASLRTTATRQGDGYVLNGGKIFITNGDRADVVVAFATVDASARQRGITAFLVPGSDAHLKRGRTLDKLGMRGSSTVELFFDDLWLPLDARLGDEGEGWRIVMNAVLKSRVSAAAQGVGLARAAYARALAWAQDAGYLGTAGRQDVDFRLATLRTKIMRGRLVLYSVARAVDDDANRDAGAEIAMMKVVCTELGSVVCMEVVDLLGPQGDLTVIGVERQLRDVRAARIYDGTNEVQQLLIARDTAKRVIGTTRADSL